MPEPSPFNLMIIANRTCPCPGLPEDVAERFAGRTGRVLIVAPALNSRLRHFTSDVDGAVAAARDRLDIALGMLRDAGFEAHGEVGDADPVLAIEDALHAFAAHAVLVSTWPEGRSNWLERNLLERARERVAVPVDHVVSRYGLADAPALLG